MTSRLERNALLFALLVAWVATLGSLYFSEVRHYTPCTWCWYQRILMYPIALILTVGLLRRDLQLPYYTLLFSGLGIAASTYHYLLQKTDWFSESTVCTGSVPCSFDYINWLGFITIPFLALVAFVLIFFASILAITGQPAFEEEDRAPWLPVGAIVAAVLLAFAPSFLMAEPAAAEPPTISIGGNNAEAEIPTLAAEGADLYREACSGCHGPRAEGVQGLGTALTDSEYVTSGSTEKWIAIIREGIPPDHPDNVTGIPMPPNGGRPDLTDADLTAILHYVHSLGPALPGE
jgi:disulfide bond formation protein DsbB/mono/diheme cytochrome c family protein